MFYSVFLIFVAFLGSQRVSVLPQAILTEPEASVAGRLKGCSAIKLLPVQLSLTHWSESEPIGDYPKAESEMNYLVRARLERIIESSKTRLVVYGVGESSSEGAVLSLSLQERYDREGRLLVEVFLVVRDQAVLVRNGEKLLVPVYEAKGLVVKPTGPGIRQTVQDLVDNFARVWTEANRSTSPQK
jgi:hypothetical protein